MIVQTIEISLSKGRAPELLAHLGESNRQIEMIPDVTLPETAGAEVDIVKPDGTFAIQTASITDGHIIVTLPDQACTVKGLSHYILKITDTGTVIYSAYGNIFVDDHLITDSMIESIAEANGYQFPDDFMTDDKLEANPSGSATNTLYRLKIFDTIYGLSGGGGGADVEANPTGTPTDTLDALRVDETIYELEKPIPVEANPTGTPTGTLDALRVDDNIYEVEKPIPVEANPTGAATVDLEKIKIGSTIYDANIGEIYNTNEHIIGKWIDGAPIYEKTIPITSISSSNTDLADITDLNIKTIIYLGGVLMGTALILPIPLTDSSANYSVVFVTTAPGIMKIRGRASFGNGLFSSGHITIRYTKN